MDSRFKKVAIEAALLSGKLIKRSVGKVHSISFKGRINIVTDVDKKSEALIIRHIRRAFPDHAILSEEGEPLSGSSPYRWVIDPIDGTTNFAHAFPFFCVSIALEQAGRSILGVVYDPMRDELFTAETGGGAYLNGRKIHVSKTAALGKSFLATGFSYCLKDAKDNNVRNFENFLTRVLAIRRAGSAALDLCYVACGRFDGFWEMDLKPWDSAAASLIVTEAGGRITKFDGSRFSPFVGETLASNGFIHRQMVKILPKTCNS